MIKPEPSLVSFQNPISSVKLKNLKQSPIEILYPTESCINIISFIGINYRFGTVPYTINGASFVISPTPELSDFFYYEFSPEILLNTENSFSFFGNFHTSPLGYPVSPYENKSVYLINIGENDVSEGDGEISVLVWREVINVSQ